MNILFITLGTCQGGHRQIIQRKIDFITQKVKVKNQRHFQGQISLVLPLDAWDFAFNAAMWGLIIHCSCSKRERDFSGPPMCLSHPRDIFSTQNLCCIGVPCLGTSRLQSMFIDNSEEPLWLNATLHGHGVISADVCTEQSMRVGATA